MRLGNMATLAREWAAVQRFQFSPFKDVLLTAKYAPSARAATALEVPTPLMQHLRATYNESQLAALTGGLDGRPFVLVQGPPGTGKTQCAPIPHMPAGCPRHPRWLPRVDSRGKRALQPRKGTSLACHVCRIYALRLC